MSKAPTVRPPLVVTTLGKKKRKAQRTKNASESLQNHVGKHNLVANLVSAPRGMKLGQLFCADVDESRKQLQRLVVKTFLVTQAFLFNLLDGTRRLKVYAVMVYDTETHALMDTGAVPVLPWNFCENFTLAPKATDHQVSIVGGTIFHVFVCLEEVSASCGSLLVLLTFLMLCYAPFDAIVGSTTLNYLRAGLSAFKP